MSPAGGRVCVFEFTLTVMGSPCVRATSGLWWHGWASGQAPTLGGGFGVGTPLKPEGPQRPCPLEVGRGDGGQVTKGTVRRAVQRARTQC